MSVLFGLRRQSAAATALSHLRRLEKRCRASFATALQTALLFALAVLGPSAMAQTPSTNNVRFQVVDIFADSSAAPLAAYQLEFTVTSGKA